MASPTLSSSTHPPQDRKPKPPQDNDGLHKRRGVWYYRLRVDGVRRELSTRTRNYQEARKVRQQMVEAERTGGLPTDLSRSPFAKVAEDWLVMRKVTVAPKTYASDR